MPVSSAMDATLASPAPVPDVEVGSLSSMLQQQTAMLAQVIATSPARSSSPISTERRQLVDALTTQRQCIDAQAQRMASLEEMVRAQQAQIQQHMQAQLALQQQWMQQDRQRSQQNEQQQTQALYQQREALLQHQVQQMHAQQSQAALQRERELQQLEQQRQQAAAPAAASPKTTYKVKEVDPEKLADIQWKFEKERVLLQERVKREEKEQQIALLEKELELLQEERRAAQEKRAREEAAAARQKEKERELVRLAEAEAFELELQRQEEEKQALEREVRALQEQQLAAEAEERERERAAKRAKEDAQRKEAERVRSELLAECRRLEQAKEDRQRQKEAQFFNSARADDLLRKHLKGAAASPPRGLAANPPVSTEATQNYLRFVETLDGEQRKLLIRSGWTPEAIQKLQQCELTRRQLRAADGHPLPGTTPEQLQELQALDRWQKWNLDSDVVLGAATGEHLPIAEAAAGDGLASPKGLLTERAAEGALHDSKLAQRPWLQKAASPPRPNAGRLPEATALPSYVFSPVSPAFSQLQASQLSAGTPAAPPPSTPAPVVNGVPPHAGMTHVPRTPGRVVPVLEAVASPQGGRDAAAAAAAQAAYPLSAEFSSQLRAAAAVPEAVPKAPPAPLSTPAASHLSRASTLQSRTLLDGLEAAAPPAPAAGASKKADDKDKDLDHIVNQIYIPNSLMNFSSTRGGLFPQSR
eukprot:TRINITY_DN688_c3_g1_i1.p1 TRINITY_DN688_c3_g1~~TRINITY_DN688_c3_g1_i1.p1  ORF type:complete len:720 (+),score=344.83 TRINITY_DN688_c3_g1_i1:52-2160(+)